MNWVRFLGAVQVCGCESGRLTHYGLNKTSEAANLPPANCKHATHQPYISCAPQLFSLWFSVPQATSVLCAWARAEPIQTDSAA